MEISTNKGAIQNKLIEQIKQSISSNRSIADELAELLNVSIDSAYRRIRGETALTIDEVSKICNHYRIPFEYAGIPKENGNSVIFNYNHLSDKNDSFKKYLNKICYDLKRIKSTDSKEIIFAAEDAPLFHHFCFEKLTAFKLFYWSRSILNNPNFEEKKFDENAISEELKIIAKEIYEYYLQIPSTEIWTEDTLNTTLKQVEYYWDSGLFKSKEEVLIILEEMVLMIKKIEVQAAQGYKFKGNNPNTSEKEKYKLYQSDLMIGNNCILIKIATTRNVYLSHNTFNAIVTTNSDFCDETENWLNNLIKKSILISGVSEKQRFRFFKILYEKIEKVRNRIKN